MRKKKSNINYEKKYKDNFGGFCLYCLILAIIFGADSIREIIWEIKRDGHVSEGTFFTFFGFLGSIFLLYGLNWAYKAIETLNEQLEDSRPHLKVEWVSYVVQHPEIEITRDDGKIERAARIEEAKEMYLHVVTYTSGTSQFFFQPHIDFYSGLDDYFNELENDEDN